MNAGTVAVIGAALAAPVRAERVPAVLAELTGVPLPADRAAELESAWTACEDAGVHARVPAGVGVYLASGGENPAGGGEPPSGGGEGADGGAASDGSDHADGADPADGVGRSDHADRSDHASRSDRTGRSDDAGRAEELARLLGLSGPRWTGRDPLAEAVAAVRSKECDLALVGADGAFAVLTRADDPRTPTFGYLLGSGSEWPDNVSALAAAALAAGRPAPGRRVAAPGGTAAGSLAAGAADGSDLGGVSALDGGAAPEGPAPEPDAPAPREPAVPLTLSAHSVDALRMRAADLRALLAAEPELPLVDVAYSLATTRPVLDRRAVLVAADRAALAEELLALSEGRLPLPGLAAPVHGDRGVGPAADGPVLVFPGHGPQWLGMADELLSASPVFAEHLHACAEALTPHVDWPVIDVLRGTADTPSLERPDVGQPALWAMTVSLSALWRSWGVRPGAVVGSSVGEIMAATVAGALSVEDGARVVALFSQAQVHLLEHGVMLSVLAGADDVRERLTRYEGLDLAAVHAPGSVLVSGAEDAATELLAELAADGVRARSIAIRLAAHGRQVDSVRDLLLDGLAPIRPRATEVPIHTATTGSRIDPLALTADHWFRNMRRTADFESATRSVLGAGHRLFLEPSPHPVLTRAVQETAETAEAAEGTAREVAVVGTLRRDRGGADQMTAALAELHAHGVLPDWDAVFAGRDARAVPLPAYPLHAAPAAAAAPSFADRVADAPDRTAFLLDVVRAQVAAVVGAPRGGDADIAADIDAPLLDLGVDSAGAVSLRNLLNAATGLNLPVSAVFDNPTCRGLARHVDRVLLGAPADDDEPIVPTGAGDDDPIAIVAMSCRLPGGVRSPEDLWELLAAEGDGVTAFPTDRGWDLEGRYDEDAERAGGYYQREAGFLHDVHQFDPEFFGISPREALAMDPQQRLLLEISWEAIERAGIDPAGLRGSRAGVFVGAMAMDYAPKLHEAPADLEGYLLTGNTASVASGRLSYTFGFAGPAVTVDTACSSSLTALHMAVQSLRRGECPLALAGGVTTMSTQGLFVEFSRQRALAPDGRCKAFSASADGFGLAEGATMVLLERLSDARRNGHPVLALVKGTAINQDGASNGLTAPSGPAQRRVIRQALADAGVPASEVDAVEAHGTGTRLGDPIEADALLATYGREHPADRPLLLGSVKSNIGHTQAASGVAGLIKMVLALRHGVLPRSLHITEPTPHVDWTSGAVSLATEATAWPEVARPRRAGVSSFGISGTNAHAVLEQAPDQVLVDPPADPQAASGPVPLVLSARTEDALRAHAGQLAPSAARFAPADVAATLLSRSVFDHRAVVVSGGTDALAAVAGGMESARVAVGVARPAGKVAFVFPGQGSQWLGMGAELARSSPVFRASLDACAEALAPHVDWSLHDALADAAQLERVDVVQPALFAVMVSLAALWRSYGVEPDAVVGHSQGEIAAAYVAGALSLDDAAKVVALRSKAILALSGRGGMVSLAVTVDRARERTARWDGRISVAAVNGPRSVVVAGDADALDELMESCAADDVRARRVPVDYASHSPHVERLQEALAQALAGVEPRPATVPMLSTVTGDWLTGTEVGAGYWYRNLRNTVRFQDATHGLLDHGVGVFVECSPHPVLTIGVRETVEAAEREAIVVGTLRRTDGDLDRFLLSAAEAYVEGLPFDWSAVVPAGRPVDLPTYPFQRRRFWLDEQVRPSAAGDPALAEFWSAVERGDLATTLDVPADAPLTDVLPSLADWRRRRQERSAVDAWRHRITWRPLTAPDAPALSGTWLVVGSPAEAEHPWRAAAVEALRAHGADVVEADGTADSLRALDVVPEGVLSLLALDEEADPAAPAVPSGLSGTLALVRALGEAGIGAPLWLATTGAVSVGRSDPLTHPVQSQTWGLGLSVGLEHPERWGGLVDLPVTPDARAAARLAAVLAGPSDEDQLAIRASGVSVRRLTPAPAPAEAPAWRAAGTVLITGGTGAIGGHVARWLAGNGAEHLVLTSRSGTDAPGAPELRDELTGLGVRTTIAACDAADRTALADLFARLDAEGTPVRSVFHAAGTVPSLPLADTGTSDLAYALGAKAVGAAHLDELCAGRELDAFVLFSSGSAVWGSGELGAYGAANAFLDGLAQRRRAEGLPATSLSWGMWAGGGMVTGDLDDQLRRRGLRPMRPELAVGALATALATGETTLTVADVDWARFTLGFTAARARPLISEIPDVVALAAEDAAEQPAAAGGALAERLTGLNDADRHRLLLDLVRGHAAAVLGHEGPDTVTPDRAFRELGVDSLTAIELRKRLNAATGVRLPATVVFDHPTPEALATRLHSVVLGERPDEAPAGTAVTGAADRAADEPIAVVAMSCRYPGGVRGPEDLWSLVLDGRDAIGAFPDDRGWDTDRLYPADAGAHGRSTTLEGAFLDEAGGFDAAFFGIAPREALAMDPQQRQVLELAWEAFERAGIDPSSVRDSLTGVFVGASPQGYAGTLEQAAPEMDGYRLTGDALSVVSGRIAYSLGLRGPAVTVDTACSSSLVALHLAVQALRSGECSMALAGGTAVMASPVPFAEFSLQGGLAPDGRCKPFADAADGVGWGEGAGLLLLERLSDARANGHEVLAVVRGSATNQDGASNGLSAPSGPAQQRVIQAALTNAGLSAAEVDAVEGHGTGTRLGDPIEAQALLAAYGQGRPADRPLLLGALKSNIGHTQAASGVAGIIKMVQAMRHGVLPRTLHLDRPSEHVDWTTGAVELLPEQRPWPETGRPRRAAVSAFGVSGTNGHVILEQGEAAVTQGSAGAAQDPGSVAQDFTAVAQGSGSAAGGAEGRALAWALSARDTAALREQAVRLAASVDARPELNPVDVATTLATGRAALDHRAVVLGTGTPALRAGLDALAAGTDDPAVVRGAPDGGRLAVLFSGQGSQRVGMGRDLYAAHPVFADALDEVFAHLDALLDVPLRDVVFGADQAVLDRTEYAQPALFAVEVALYRLWESWGLRPDALAGHSIGELAAAHVAGVFSLADACTIVAARGALMQALPAGGAMVAVRATEDEIAPECSEHVGIAAVNGPESLVLSGSEAEVMELADRLRAQGRKVTRLRVSHAFHSPLMEPMLAEFRRVVAGTTAHPPTLPIVSTLTGAPVGAEELTAPDHWVQHVRRPVRFADGVTALVAQGVTTMVEVGPGSALTAMGQDSAPGAVFVPTLRSDRPEPDTLALAAAQLYVRGAPLDLTAVTGGRGNRVDLPTYAFQHERYWLSAAVAPAGDGATAALGVATGGHPLLRAAVALPDSDGVVFTGRLSARTQAWLADHGVGDQILFPGTGHLDLALHAADHCGLDTVEELTLHAPLVLPERGGRDLRVTVGAETEGRRSIRVHSRADDADRDAPWTEHATGSLTSGTLTSGTRTADGDPAAELSVWPPRGATPMDSDGIYERLAELGYSYGPVFRAVRAAWSLGSDVYVEVSLPDGTGGEGFSVHPALLDASLHAPVLRALDEAGGGPRLPFSFTGVRLHSVGASTLRVRWTPTGQDEMSLAVADRAGRPVATVESLVMRPVELRKAAPRTADALFSLEWAAADGATEERPVALAVLGAERNGRGDLGLDIPVVADFGALADVTDLLAFCPRPTGTYGTNGTNGTNGKGGTDGQGGPDGTEAQSVRAAVSWALALAKDWLADERTADTRLVFVTRGAVDTEAPDPAQAAVWGLVRSAQTENPGRFALVDLDGTAESALAVRTALASGEPQSAVRAGRVTAPRLARATADHLLVPPADGPWRLDAAARGSLRELALVPHPEATAPLAPGQVRVAVRAAGLDFRDVLVALGAHHGEGEPGSEIAGVVTEVGAAVTDLAVGDRVLGMATTGVGPLAVADRRLLAPMPAGWSFARAASVPLAFLTAHYALHDLADLRRGEAVLVHDAAGDIGLAAVQLARHRGAEVFATASPAEWDAVRAAGVPDTHLASSLDTGFAARFAAETGGRGVRVVLNSLVRELVDGSAQRAKLSDGTGGLPGPAGGSANLPGPADASVNRPGLAEGSANLPGLADASANLPNPADSSAQLREPSDGSVALSGPTDGPARTPEYTDDSPALREFVRASLELLPDGGRFIELGRADVPEPDDLPAGVKYATFDQAQPDPDRFQDLLAEVLALFAAGALSPLPVRAWDVRRAPEAFRHLSEGRHAGKVVLTVPAPLDPDRTVLVTGGLGTLGALVARHLVTARGARHLVLTGRAGLATDGARELRAELAALGAEVRVAACDVSDRDALAALVASLDRPLGAVVHAAGVVDDGVLAALTPERVDRVLAPKVDGLLHLDELTRDADLSAFVVFSSAAGILGSAGQASYAAANAALDALVRRRHAHGLPGVSLAWGMWAAASGMTAGLDADDRARLGRSGILELPTGTALDLLDAATDDDRAALVPVLLDTATLRGQAADGTLPPILRGLVRTPARRVTAAPATASATFTDTVAGQSAADREQTVLDLVCAQVAAVLGHSAGTQVDPGRALQDLGFDSLTSVELRNRLTAATGIRLPSTLVFDHPSAAAITRHVLTLLPSAEAEAETGVLDQLDRLESTLLALGDDGTATKVDLRLRALLARWSDARADDAAEDAESDDLSAATDDELFGYLDNELETS
ncbi:type I polyketide synthase [Streptomyces sp. NPDC017941]|uniref:type I polyketide synthase n=1 Tax=Streptomyces sp. NPDC017941 TaxID=3365018 RepID=UPI00378B595B